MTIEECVEFIQNSNGRVFAVRFIKKDGSIRTMNCRLGVTSYLKGTGSTYDAKEHGIITVFDMHAHGYRAVTINKIIGIKKNQKWEVVSHVCEKCQKANKGTKGCTCNGSKEANSQQGIKP